MPIAPWFPSHGLPNTQQECHTGSPVQAAGGTSGGQRGDSLTCRCTASELFPDGGQQQLFPNRGLKRENNRKTHQNTVSDGWAQLGSKFQHPSPHLPGPHLRPQTTGEHPPGHVVHGFVNSSPHTDRHE